MTKKIIVIGAGPGGYETAIRAAQLGLDVKLIDKDKKELGGTCLNRGCIPTKTYFKNAEIANSFNRKEEFGFEFDNYNINGKRLQERKNEVVTQIRSGIEFLVGSYKNLELIEGLASFVDSKTIKIALKEGGEREETADYIVIATGSVPFVPPIKGADLEGIMTSDELLDIDYVPESMAIIGGGVIGLEFGCIYNELGTKVSVITNEVLGSADEEIQKRMPSFLKKAGIELIKGARASLIEKDGDGYKVTADIIGKDKTKEVSAKTLLIATGRRPFYDGLNLEAAGIEVDRGIVVDENLETTAKGVYAIGDVIKNSMQLAHWASFQGVSLVEKLVKGSSEIVIDVVPAATFSFPEVSQVGITEQEAKEKGIKYVKSKFNFSGNGKAVSLGEAEGFVKIIAKEDLSEILGVHIVGPHANDLIHEGAIAIANKLSVSDIAKVVHAHPTLSEAFMEAVHQLEGASIHSAPAK